MIRLNEYEEYDVITKNNVKKVIWTKYKVITDLRVLNSITKKYGLIFDSDYKYILNKIPFKTEHELNKQKYKIKYFSGCFYPYLIKLIN